MNLRKFAPNTKVVICKWRDKFLEGGRKAFISPESERTKKLKKKIEELEKIIGCQTVQIEILKKPSRQPSREDKKGDGTVKGLPCNSCT